MSRIDELIERFCPDGIEFKTLRSVASYSQDRIDSSAIVPESYVGVNELLPNFRGRTSGARASSETKCTEFSRNDILLGNIRPYLKKMWLADCSGGTNGDVLVIRIIDQSHLSPKFLWQVLASNDFVRYNVQHSHGAKMPRGDKAAILNYRIPLPPIEIQEEIVQILDSFSGLEMELRMELEQRRKQYYYYRDQLLSRTTLERLAGTKVQTSTLNSCCQKILAGGDVPSSTKRGQVAPSDERPFPVFSNGSKEKSLYGFASTYRVDSDSVTIAARGSIGFHAVRKAPFTPVIRLIALIPDTSILDVRYLDYALSQTSIEGDKGGIPQLTIPKVKKINILLPPLNIQQQIVNVLDRFNNLTDSFTSGIPAEIEARRKQYEYYRDKLLTFKEKPGD